MSAGDRAVDGPDPRDERRVAGALDAFGTRVRPDPDAWDRIAARLDAGPARTGRGGPGGSTGGDRRPFLVAAAAVVLIVLAGAIVVRARSTDTDVQLATSTADEQLTIVALTDDQRLVELGLDGVERREIYRSPDDGTRLVGRLAVSTRDGVVYVERTATRSGPCGDAGVGGGGERVGQIVAVPLAGGEPRVEVAIGRQPDVDPATGRLAFLTTPNGRDCLGGDTYNIAVRDPATGYQSGAVVASAADGETVLEPRWGPTGADVLTLIASGSGIPHREVVRVRFAGTQLLAGLDTVLTTRVVGGEPMADPLVGVTSIDPVVPGSGGGDRLITAGPTPDGSGAVRVFERRVEPQSPSGPLVITTTNATTFDPRALGTEPLLTSDVDVDLASGAILLAAQGSGAADIPYAEPQAATDEGDATTESTTSGRVVVPLPTGSSTYLFVAEGGQPRVVARGIVAATWLRANGPLPVEEPPDTLVAPSPSPGSTAPGTTVPAPSLPGTVPPSTQTPVDVVGSSERPEDAAAIAGAFRAFFEQGDQSALEGSGILEPALDEGAKTVPNGGKGVTVTIDAIIFTGEGSAEVRFRLDQNGNYFTAATAGTAVVVDGRWKVSAATMCTLLSRVSIPCPTAP